MYYDYIYAAGLSNNSPLLNILDLPLHSYVVINRIYHIIQGINGTDGEKGMKGRPGPTGPEGKAVRD